MTEGTSGGRNLRDRMVSDYQGYKVYDRDGEKLGKVEYTVLDESDQPQYLGVKTGFFGTKTTLIPEELIRLDDNNEFTVEATESQVNDAPTISDEDDAPQDIENNTLSHYGLGGAAAGAAAGAASSGSSTRSDSDYDDQNRSDRNDRDRDYNDRDYNDRDYNDESRSESRGRDYDNRDESRSEGRSRDDDHDRDREDSRSSSGALGGAAAGAGAGAAASSFSRSDRDRHDDHDTEYRNTNDVEGGREGSSSSRSRGGQDDGEKIRVTLKREQARAERTINEDGEEEVRIRKKTVKEEVLIDVEDADNSGR